VKEEYLVKLFNALPKPENLSDREIETILIVLQGAAVRYQDEQVQRASPTSSTPSL